MFTEKLSCLTVQACAPRSEGSRVHASLTGFVSLGA